MSLIYTEGYLSSELIGITPKSLPENIKNIFIIPPANNTEKITVFIYDYDKYHPIYELCILSNPLLLKDFKSEENHNYQISVDKGSVWIYYETKEAIINE